MPLWRTSEWERPLSNLTTSRRACKHTTGLHALQQHQHLAEGQKYNGFSYDANHPASSSHTQQQTRYFHGQFQSSVDLPPLEGGDVSMQGHAAESPESPMAAAGHPVAERLIRPSTSPAVTAWTSSDEPSSPTSQRKMFAVHYVGLAQGELGVLTKKQVLPARPTTSPSLLPSSQGGWRPSYGSIQSPPSSLPANDIRRVVDDAWGQSKVPQNVFNGKPLHTQSPPRASERLSRWMHETPQRAAPSHGYMTTSSRPRMLSAGGFSGWKLSLKQQAAGAHVRRPEIPDALRQRPRTSPAAGSSGSGSAQGLGGMGSAVSARASKAMSNAVGGAYAGAEEATHETIVVSPRPPSREAAAPEVGQEPHPAEPSDGDSRGALAEAAPAEGQQPHSTLPPEAQPDAAAVTDGVAAAALPAEGSSRSAGGATAAAAAGVSPQASQRAREPLLSVEPSAWEVPGGDSDDDFVQHSSNS